ncbi:GNAT family N-acetyltransferase [Sphingomonas azotifigens]|uniref:GNAT family N-acetyltransferase n=1 Tax=Sphingomonas azotifigens TaxID=330920 RepID=UPI001FE325E9|nr:GNAT family N-acetyltransferase [Sphingomonas azotifigens]
MTLRPMQPDDLAQALVLQEQVYPAFLVEPAEAFASRLAVAAPYCLVAERDGVLLGYLLAHGWPCETPPPVGAVLDPAQRGDTLFLHDLAVAAAGRGGGIGEALVARAFALAAANGLRRAELIAVEGAAAYWERLGFLPVPTSPALAAKVAGYGTTARWMARPIMPGDDGFGGGARLG